MTNKRTVNLVLALLVGSLSPNVFAAKLCGKVTGKVGQQKHITLDRLYWTEPVLIALNDDVSNELDELVGKEACVVGDKAKVLSFAHQVEKIVEVPTEFIFVHSTAKK